jgi:hypothetical protein
MLRECLVEKNSPRFVGTLGMGVIDGVKKLHAGRLSTVRTILLVGPKSPFCQALRDFVRFGRVIAPVGE